MDGGLVKLDTKRNRSRFKPPVCVWSRCLPFVENSRGMLIHRPKYVHIYNIHKYAHMAVGYWCGNGTTGGKNITFLSAPPEGKLVCARCEAAAVAADEKSTDLLCGHHRHIGVVVAQQACCTEADHAT